MPPVTSRRRFFLASEYFLAGVFGDFRRDDYFQEDFRQFLGGFGPVNAAG